jgi:50S ribosomal protein L16 3-hydroxylase
VVREMPHDPDQDAGCLTRLFPTHSAASFVERCWPEQPLVFHGPLARLGALGALPELETLERLLGAYGDRVRVALPDKRDEHSSLQVDALTAATLHRAGMALILNGVERFFPVVEQWLGGLRRELGLPLKCEPRSIIYVTPAGGGNSPHFDANANFVVQLRGTKRWRLAPNHAVRHPSDRWAMNQAEVPDELAAELSGTLPEALPEDAQTIDLLPGSVLFVPRGFWHATEAGEDTLALNFTFGQPSWADLVLTALRQRLLADEGWRALADGLCAADPARVEAGRAQLVHRLGLLQAEVAQLQPEAIIASLDLQPAYLLEPEAFLRVEDGVVIASIGGEEDLELEAEENLHPVVEWIAEQGAPFSLELVSRHFPTVVSELPALLAALRAKGVLGVV